jgi:hypothetical protein
MLYLVTVANVFDADRPGEFDLYEIQVLIRAESPRTALFEAISFSRASDTWKRLGYFSKSMLHAVRKIDHEFSCHASLMSSLLAARLPQLWLVNRIRMINEEELQRLESFHNIQLSYGLIHVDEKKA